MSEVLTQSQIDALLNSVQESGLNRVAKAESDQKRFRKYDFNTPKKFTKDRLRLLNSVYENYSRILASYLSSMLRLTCEIELVNVEEQRYYEFNNALTEDDIIAFVDVTMENESQPEEEPVMMQMSQSVIYCMIDRMLGGTGDIYDDDEESVGGYTEIELAIYENIVQYMTPPMSDVWQNYVNMQFKYEKIETNPRLIQSVGIDEIVVIVVFGIKIKETSGRITLSLPGSILDQVFKQFEQMNSSQNRRKDHQSSRDREEIVRGVESSKLELTAKFGDSRITLEELYSIRVGDILNLNVPRGSDLELCVENRPWFKGRLGVLKDRVAVKINGSIEEERIFMEEDGNE